MEGFAQVFVQYHQFQVILGDAGGGLQLYTVGDELAQLVNESTLTVMTGPHTGWVAVRSRITSGPPEDIDGWEAATEATLWCPDGAMAVCGLLGDCPDALSDMSATAPGLVRVQVRARNRRPDGSPPSPAAPEQYEVLAWPVPEDVGLRTLRTDDLPPVDRRPDPAEAAAWAVVRMVAKANPDPREASLRAVFAPEPRQYPRVDVRRSRSLPAAAAAGLVRRPGSFFGATADGDDLVVRTGDVEVRLDPAPPTRPEYAFAQWRWSAAPGSAANVPDATASTVELAARFDPANNVADLTVRHSGVRPEDAVLLGFVWEYLLHRAASLAAGGVAPRHPWEAVFDDIAAKALQETAAARRMTDLREAPRWGGRLPSERLRTLPANTIGLARLDRGLVDALAEATPEQQRDVARWAARQACTVAGLADIDWIAAALAAMEQGTVLPAPFDDDVRAGPLLWADERVPRTVVTTPDGTPNALQQAARPPGRPGRGQCRPAGGRRRCPPRRRVRLRHRLPGPDGRYQGHLFVPRWAGTSPVADGPARAGRRGP